MEAADANRVLIQAPQAMPRATASNTAQTSVAASEGGPPAEPAFPDTNARAEAGGGAAALAPDSKGSSTAAKGSALSPMAGSFSVLAHF
jgi:hypothetical protein